MGFPLFWEIFPFPFKGGQPKPPPGFPGYPNYFYSNFYSGGNFQKLPGFPTAGVSPNKINGGETVSLTYFSPGDPIPGFGGIPALIGVGATTQIGPFVPGCFHPEGPTRVGVLFPCGLSVEPGKKPG